MAGLPRDDNYLDQFSPHFEDVRDDFARLGVNDKKEKDRTFQSRPKVSSAHPSGTPMHYKYYVFTRTENWKVADKVEIIAPQEELERKVAKGKKTNSVLEAMKNMSGDRRAQINRLLAEKNLANEHGDAEWQCVLIESPSPRNRRVHGKIIREHLKMDVIIAQHILPDERKASSPRSSKSFVGKISDINEPLKPEGKSKEKSMDKPSQAGKEAKSGKEDYNDPFARVRLFNEEGRPLDKNGPIPEYLPQQIPQQQQQQLPQQIPQHHFFNQGMGQPGGPPRAQHVGPSQPTGPAANPVFGDPFSLPTPASKLPNGIEIMNDPHPPQNDASGIFPVQNLPPREQFGKSPNQPVIMQEPPKRGHHHKQGSVYDSSSRGSDDECFLFEDDERSSHTSYGDDHERLPVKKGEKAYREHRRGLSYPIEPPRRIEARRRESRYSGGREQVETIVPRPRRRHSSRERCEQVRYVEPRRLEYGPRSPTLTPISNSSYSPPRRPPGLPYPDELLDRERDDRERERRAEEYMRMDALREREEAVRRRERELNDREFLDRSGVKLGRRFSGHGRYDRYDRYDGYDGYDR
ncbi:hypothetical protein GJ744_005421 [Endocarpon pusillum]|uniref:Uncharacterized protein n=1 Tax=Endocarpon pusillum TaxID=364733 RepID=A0A8H7A8J9_9EURO|nr:hypothetical protein GJ744_005421 [Endocarpon pusillum]